MPRVSLLPLNASEHGDLLHAVYVATPAYWHMYAYASAPPGQAEQDLRAAADTPGRTIMGVVRPVNATRSDPGLEMVGMMDFRLHYPEKDEVSVGMIMVAETHQRQRVASAAWALLEPWLVETAGMQSAHLTVEQFNLPALQFFKSIGFAMTGEAERIKVGDKFVRLLTMKKRLQRSAGASSPSQQSTSG